MNRKIIPYTQVDKTCVIGAVSVTIVLHDHTVNNWTGGETGDKI